MLSPLGDTLFATPAIRALGENFSKARFLILANPPAAKVLKSNPYGMDVIVPKDQWDLLKNLTLARKAKYDLALGLSQLGSVFNRFCGALDHFDFFDIDFRSDRPVTQMCIDIIRRAGCIPGSRRTEFWMSPWEEAAAAETVTAFLNPWIERGSPMIAIHCGGHYFIRKRWPLDYFIQLIHHVHRKTDLSVVLVGGREDFENSLTIQKAAPKAINAVGRFKLTETAVLLKNCKLYLGNDSGPLHLAAAMRTPTLGLFGPTAPGQFYPYFPPFHTFIYKDLSCSPCYKFGGSLWQQIPRCSKAYCMEAITPEEVIEEVELKLKQTNQGSLTMNN